MLREAKHTNLSRAHKSRGAEGRPGELKEEHTSLHNAAGVIRDQRKHPHKPLPVKLQSAVQGGAREQKHQQ